MICQKVDAGQEKNDMQKQMVLYSDQTKLLLKISFEVVVNEIITMTGHDLRGNTGTG